MNFWQWLDNNSFGAFIFLFAVLLFGIPLMAVYVHNNDKTFMNYQMNVDAGAP